MKKKVVWLVVTGLLVAALLLASCAPAVVEEKKVAPPKEKEEEVVPKKEVVVPEKKVEMVKWTGTKRDGTVVEKMIEKPRYGGTITQAKWSDYTGADPAWQSGIGSALTMEQLISGDWAKGPAGTGEASWLYYTWPFPWILQPILTTGWEMPDPDTAIFHIRQGVHFHNKPPTNGREMTAADVAFSLIRRWQNPGSYQYQTYPWATHLESITAPDKWTVVLKALPGMLGAAFDAATIISQYVYPPEAVEKYKDLTDWKNAQGTGPFILVDYVAGSASTYTRNPNYWGKDPMVPENTLPYVDTVKQLIIPDKSTRIAALRTGKIDAIFGESVYGTGALEWEDARSLMKTNPELKYVRYVRNSQQGIAPKLWDAALPWGGYTENALKVRRALSMAINYQEMVDTYYGGEAEILAWPMPPIPDLMDLYTPLKELSSSIRELYEYHPDRARQLLAEAGYPKGFKTEIVARSFEVDILSIVKEYWSKVGVDLSIRVVEPAVFNTLRSRKTYGDMILDENNVAVPQRFAEIGPGKAMNPANIDDPRINEAYVKVSAAIFDIPKAQQLLKELFPYLMEQNYQIMLPAGYYYTFWQPWLKGYHGEAGTGYGRDYGWAIWTWVDQELKEEMTGRK